MSYVCFYVDNPNIFIEGQRFARTSLGEDKRMPQVPVNQPVSDLLEASLEGRPACLPIPGTLA